MKPLGENVRRELSRFGPAVGMTEVVAVWPASVGPAIARNAWPARLARDGTLHVATSSSAWAFELTQLEPAIRAKLGELLETSVPRALRFAVGPLPESEPDPVTSSRQTVPTPSQAAKVEASRIAAPIASKALREAVARAAAASLAAAENSPSDRPVW
jgi:hypothetical protein